MKVYLQPPITASRALDRVEAAFRRHAGEHVNVIVESPLDAHLVVVPVVGRLDHVTRQVQQIVERGQQYAIVQYVLRSSKNKSTADWLPLWKGAKAVWSYYDLPALCREDGQKPKFNFYHAPLGVEPVFLDAPAGISKKAYTAGSFSRHWLTESHREIVLAAAETLGFAWHMGPLVRFHDHCVELVAGDQELADIYGRTAFMPGLRRVEGFELPAAEGLLCGAQPILFDRPHYRQWYDGLGAEFISEGDRGAVFKALVKLFRRGPTPPTKAHLKQARRRFNWERILAGFWGACA